VRLDALSLFPTLALTAGELPHRNLAASPSSVSPHPAKGLSARIQKLSGARMQKLHEYLAVNFENT